MAGCQERQLALDSSRSVPADQNRIVGYRRVVGNAVARAAMEADAPSKFEITKDKASKYRFRLKAGKRQDHRR